MSDDWSQSYATRHLDQEQEQETTAKASRRDDEDVYNENVILITIDEDLVRNLAQEISQQNLSWDECVWLLAEGELRLAQAYINPKITPSGLAELGNSVRLDPTKVEEQPTEGEIRVLATKVAQQGPRIDELHWFLAVRKVLYDDAKLKTQ